MTGPGSSPSIPDLGALRAVCVEAMSNLPPADDVYAEKVAPEIVLALIEYVEANEAWLDPTVNPTVEAMTERNVSFNAARRALGLGEGA